MSMCDYCINNGVCNQPLWIKKAVKNDDLYCDGFKGDGLLSTSFGWTTPSYTSMNKSVTRRNWAQVTVRRFKKGKEFLAWSKQARFGGEPIGIGRLTEDPFKQSTSEMTCADPEFEGLEYLIGEYERINPSVECQLASAFENWCRSGQILTVVPFDIIEVFPGCEDKYTTDKEIIRCVKALVKVIG